MTRDEINELASKSDLLFDDAPMEVQIERLRRQLMMTQSQQGRTNEVVEILMNHRHTKFFGDVLIPTKGMVKVIANLLRGRGARE